jgi:hypothetical protein
MVSYVLGQLQNTFFSHCVCVWFKKMKLCFYLRKQSCVIGFCYIVSSMLAFFITLTLFIFVIILCQVCGEGFISWAYHCSYVMVGLKKRIGILFLFCYTTNAYHHTFVIVLIVSITLVLCGVQEGK